MHNMGPTFFLRFRIVHVYIWVAVLYTILHIHRMDCVDRPNTALISSRHPVARTSPIETGSAGKSFPPKHMDVFFSLCEVVLLGNVIYRLCLLRENKSKT
jgi:hypothetical protein